MVGGGVFALSGIVINEAGPAVIVSYLLAAIAVLLSVLCFTAVASRVKDGDSGYGPIAEVLGRRWRFLTMWAFYISTIAGCAFLLVAFGSYLQYFISGADALALGLAAALVLILLNLGPADLVGKAETVMVMFKMGVLVLLIGFGVAAFKASSLTPFAPHGSRVILASTGLLFSVYLGFSVVTNVAGVVKNPRRNVPLSILLSMLIVTLVYVGVAVAMLMSGIEVFGTTGAAQAAASLIGPWGGGFVAAAACVSTLAGSNAALMGTSELLARMAGNGDIPRALAHVSRSGRIHYSVLLSGAIALTLMITGGLRTIITYCTVAGIVGLVMMDLTALQMARRHWPTVGLNLPFGILIPVLAALAALSQLPALGWVNVLGGLALVGAGLILYTIRERSLRSGHQSRNDYPPLDLSSSPPVQRAIAASKHESASRIGDI